MGKGISVFLGMDQTLEENLSYINYAKEKGFDRIFTSLHIPEANFEVIIKEFNILISEAKKLNMEIIADISPLGFKLLNLSLEDLKGVKELGIGVLRIDFGFTAEQIAAFTRNPYGIKIEINASTVTEKFLIEFEEANPNLNNFQACHNYYPRLNTGISLATFNKKNAMLKKYNIEISAFVPSLVNKRGPVYEGLPTMETHRFMKPHISAKHLFALGIHNVFFGDSIPSKEEIDLVGGISEQVIELTIENFSNCPIENRLMFNDFHSNRSDSAEDVVRSAESRLLMKKGDEIKPFNTVERKVGYITIDNKEYLRYSGELQICKKNLPADRRVNVVGKVIEEERFLLDYIEDETKFRFKVK